MKIEGRMKGEGGKRDRRVEQGEKGRGGRGEDERGSEDGGIK
jgi:hypothetical protein